MNRLKIIDRLSQGKLTRREFTAAMAVFGVTATAMPAMLRPARAAESITWMGWAGLDTPELAPEFFAKHGASAMQATYFGDEYEGIAKLKAGFRADLCTPCIDVMPNWITANLLPIDESKLSHYPEIIDSLAHFEASRFDGDLYFVPVYWGTSSFMYRTDLTDITPEEESWALLYDERFAGKIAIWDSTDAVIPTASLVLGYKDDPFRPSGERLKKVQELLAKQAKLLRFYWAGATDNLQAFASGETVITYAWQGTAMNLIAEGEVPTVYANPKEGRLTWVCGLARATGDGDPALAHDFIDASISAEAGKAMIEGLSYGSANRNAYALVSEEKLAALDLTDPEKILAAGNPYVFVPIDLKAEHEAIFNEVKAGT